MRILLFDLETAPNLVHVWGLWGQNVGINQIIASGYTLCWAAKWHGEREIYFDSVHHSRPRKMLERIHKLISQADAIVTYNGKSFDVPTLHKEFLSAGLKPPAPVKHIDLYRVAKSEFRFPSHKLDYIAQELGIGHKTHHKGHQLWIDCMAGKEAAWKVMERYNRQDVRLLEGVYERMRPWIRTHPNVALYDEPGIEACPNCGSGKLQRRGYAMTNVNKFVRLQCQACGAWCREPLSELPTEDRRKIMRKVA